MRKRLLVSVVAVALLLGVWAMVMHGKGGPEKLLLSRSVKVADATGWNLDYGTFRLVGPSGAKSQNVYFTRNVGPPDFVELYCRKGFDGPETCLGAISHLVSTTRALMRDSQFSDDFKRLLWTSPDGQGHIANLDGTHHLHWFLNNASYVHGLRSPQDTMVRWTDGNKIIEMQRYNGSNCPLVLWRDARTLKETGRSILSKTSDINTIRPIIYIPLVVSKHILFTYDLNNWNAQGNPALVKPTTCRFDLMKNGKLLERHRITCPKVTTECLIFVNNGDNRLLWLFQSSYVSPFAVMIHRYVSAYPADPQTTLSVYESRSDGSGMHELGHVPYHGQNAYYDFYLEWAADGHCAYFVFENALYRLPVD